MSSGVQFPSRLTTMRALLIPELGDMKQLTFGGPGRMVLRNWLRLNIGPLFDEDFEHVAVLYEGQRRDMFVGETSSINGRHIRNVRATAIYRSAALRLDAALTCRRDPESLPAISGPAVLFPDVLIWN